MYRPSHVEHAGSIELLNGTFARFGPDEESPFDTPLAVSFDTEMPGGFSAANIVLPRPDDFDVLQASLFASVTLYDARSAQILYEGRITGTPMDSESVTLECEGWIRALEDDQTARFLGIDRDFSRWQAPSVQLQLNEIASNYLPVDGSTNPDPSTGASALLTECDNLWTSGATPEAIATYDAQGLDIGKIDYCWKVKAVSGEPTSGSWQWFVMLGSLDYNLTDSTSNLQGAGPGSGTLVGGTGRHFADVLFGSSTTTPPTPEAGEVPITMGVYWTLLGVVGTHGLSLQNTLATPNTGRGLLVSDMVAYLVGSFAPALNYTTGTQGTISPTSFPVPHAAWLEETTARNMITELSVYGGADLYPLDHFVYDNRTFYLQPPSQYGTVWHARRDLGMQETSQGSDAARLLNGVKVTYDDGTGTRRSVGPPGTGATLVSNTLRDTNPELPVNMDGQNHWAVFDAGITSQAGALQIGEMILNSRNTENWRGDITLQGEVENDSGIAYPVSMVRSGDWIVVDDDVDLRPRKVIHTTYSDQQLQASVGAQPDHLDSLLARAGIVLTGVL